MLKVLIFLFALYTPANTFACGNSVNSNLLLELLKVTDALLPVQVISSFYVITPIFLIISVYFFILSRKKNIKKYKILSAVSIILFLLFLMYLIALNTLGVSMGC